MVNGGLIESVDQGLDGGHHCCVSEEGLFDRPQYFFLLADWHQPLAGNGATFSRGCVVGDIPTGSVPAYQPQPLPGAC
jgi:hypothetical protein